MEKLVVELYFHEELNNEEKDNIVQVVERGIDKQGLVMNNYDWVSEDTIIVNRDDMSFILSGIKDLLDKYEIDKEYYEGEELELLKECIIKNKLLIDKYDC